MHSLENYKIIHKGEVNANVMNDLNPWTHTVMIMQDLITK